MRQALAIGSVSESTRVPPDEERAVFLPGEEKAQESRESI
jgi:hypothetical protein